MIAAGERFWGVDNLELPERFLPGDVAMGSIDPGRWATPPASARR